PIEQPQLAQSAGVKLNGEIVVSFNERKERLVTVNEQVFSNALVRLARSREEYLLMLTGHGERKLDGIASRDMGNFGKKLMETGFKSKPFNFVDNPDIPDTNILVIASPQV